jgi:hypothetical protein
MIDLHGCDLFLRESSLVTERQRPYCVDWVRRSLQSEPLRPDLSERDRTLSFPDSLRRNRNLQDWQLERAQRAVRLYLGCYRDREAPPTVCRRLSRGAPAHVCTQSGIGLCRTGLGLPRPSYSAGTGWQQAPSTCRSAGGVPRFGGRGWENSVRGAWYLVSALGTARWQHAPTTTGFHGSRVDASPCSRTMHATWACARALRRSRNGQL